jgi:L-ascorbate metabolism protein UlaG (beta-lactamase superfamily)
MQAFKLKFLLFILMAPVFQLAQGQESKKSRMDRMKKSLHYRNGKFHNLAETPMYGQEAGFFKILKSFIFSDNRKPDKTIPTVKKTIKPVNEGATEIRWFGHSSYLIQQDSLNILVDPIFTSRVSPVPVAGKNFKGTKVYSINELPQIDYLIITHDHFDHLGRNTIKRIKPKTSHFIVPLGVGRYLQRWGIDRNNITELDWWEAKELSNGHITATPARHFSGRGLRRNPTLWASYVLEIGEKKLFIGGDSGYGAHFKTIGDKFGPFDFVILECGQYSKFWPYIHMFPEETAQAAIDLKATHLFPVHWGRFSLSQHPWDEPIERLLKKTNVSGLIVATPKIGESIILDLEIPTEKWWKIQGFP